MDNLDSYWTNKLPWTILELLEWAVSTKISGSFAGMESTLDPSNDDELDRRILDQDKQTISASSE